MRTALLLAIATGLVATAADEPAVRIEHYESKSGDRFRTRIVSVEKMTSTVSLMGMDNPQKSAQTKTLDYVTELQVIGDSDEGTLTRFSRMYTTATQKLDGGTEELPYHGMTILFEKNKDGSYRFSSEGKLLPENVAADFVAEFAGKKKGSPKNRDCLPDHPVKPGDTWTTDPEKLLKTTNTYGPIVIDKKATTMKGTLVRTYRRDGHLFGVVRLDQSVAVAALKLEDRELPSAGKSQGKLTINVDLCVDGSVCTEAYDVDADFDFAFELPNGTLMLTGTSKLTAEVTPLPLK